MVTQPKVHFNHQLNWSSALSKCVEICYALYLLKVINNGNATLKQITETFSKTDSSSQKVVMFEYPRKGIQAIGFMTGSAKGEIRDKAGIEMVNVFVPTTPNPTSGFLLFIPKEDVIILDMKYEDAIKLIVSAGMVFPETSN